MEGRRSVRSDGRYGHADRPGHKLGQLYPRRSEYRCELHGADGRGRQQPHGGRRGGRGSLREELLLLGGRGEREGVHVGGSHGSGPGGRSGRGESRAGVCADGQEPGRGRDGVYQSARPEGQRQLLPDHLQQYEGQLRQLRTGQQHDQRHLVRTFRARAFPDAQGHHGVRHGRRVHPGRRISGPAAGREPFRPLRGQPVSPVLHRQHGQLQEKCAHLP